MIMSRSTAETANMLLRIRRGHCHCHCAPTHQLISSRISMKSWYPGCILHAAFGARNVCLMPRAEKERKKTEGAYEDGQAREIEEL